MAIFFPQNSFLTARAVHDGLAVLVSQWDCDADGRLSAGWLTAQTRDGGGPARHLSVAGRG